MIVKYFKDDEHKEIFEEYMNDNEVLHNRDIQSMIYILTSDYKYRSQINKYFNENYIPNCKFIKEEYYTRSEQAIVTVAISLYNKSFLRRCSLKNLDISSILWSLDYTNVEVIIQAIRIYKNVP